jgi:hypothetical protein
VLSAIFSEAATPVTAAPDPAPSQNTMSVVPFGIDTVAPVPCFMVAALLPVKEFLIIKNLVAVFGAIVTTFTPPRSDPLSLRLITANIPVCTLLCPDVGEAALIVRVVVRFEAVKSEAPKTLSNISKLKLVTSPQLPDSSPVAGFSIPRFVLNELAI